MQGIYLHGKGHDQSYYFPPERNNRNLGRSFSEKRQCTPSHGLSLPHINNFGITELHKYLMNHCEIPS